jgi:hypothetical protein
MHATQASTSCAAMTHLRCWASLSRRWYSSKSWRRVASFCKRCFSSSTTPAAAAPCVSQQSRSAAHRTLVSRRCGSESKHSTCAHGVHQDNLTNSLRMYCACLLACSVRAFYTQRCWRDAPLTGRQVEEVSWRAKFAVQVHAAMDAPEFGMVGSNDTDARCCRCCCSCSVLTCASCLHALFECSCSLSSCRHVSRHYEVSTEPGIARICPSSRSVSIYLSGAAGSESGLRGRACKRTSD